jgi:hypothetical protein
VPASEGELLHSFNSILEAFTWPEGQARMAVMAAKGWDEEEARGRAEQCVSPGSAHKELAGGEQPAAVNAAIRTLVGPLRPATT